MKPVWIVDDDRSIRWVIEKALSREGIEFNSFASAQDALDALGLLSDNQERSSRWSFPYKTAQLLGALLPGERLELSGHQCPAPPTATAGWR